MSFKLVAFDLDGTLMPRFQSIRPRVADAVRQAQARGTHITLASGRLYSTLARYARQLSLTTPLIAHHGALIADPLDGRQLYHQGVPLDLAREVIYLARERNLAVAAFIDDVVYTDRLQQDWPVYPWLMKAKARDVGDLASFLQAEPTRVAIVTEAELTKQLIVGLRQHFGERLHITSGHPLLTEMSHPDVSKARALALLASYLGIEQAEILAAGDDWNDIEMLTYAGCGVAMGDAAPEVIAVADYVAPSAEEDGAVHVLEKFVLNSVPSDGE